MKAIYIKEVNKMREIPEMEEPVWNVTHDVWEVYIDHKEKYRVEPKAILRYKIAKWMTKHGGELWGIDVIIDGKSYHVKDDKEALFFDEKKAAMKHVRKLNRELRDERSVARDDDSSNAADKQINLP